MKVAVLGGLTIHRLPFVCLFAELDLSWHYIGVCRVSSVARSSIDVSEGIGIDVVSFLVSCIVRIRCGFVRVACRVALPSVATHV